MTAIPPIRKQIVVAASAERAFDVFTNGIDRWWPRQHHIGTSPLKRVVLEPRRGGRWYAISQDDTECDTGKVLVWEPPRRVVLAWQITAKWQFDADFVTEVEVTFASEGPKRTLVTLEHRNMERFGVTAVELRGMMDTTEGWGGTLVAFADAAASAEAAAAVAAGAP